MKFELLLQQIQDPVIRENFRRIKLLIESGKLGSDGSGSPGPPGPPGSPGAPGVGVPTGGTTGQILAKLSNANYDTAWIDQIGANSLVVTMKATTALSALKLVKSDSTTHVSYATNNASYEDAQAIGITLTAASAGADVTILILGKLEDPFFTFSLGATLFVGINGNIVDVAPIAGFLTQIGHALGTGGLFINIEPPVSL
jgi:hypothetical protein